MARSLNMLRVNADALFSSITFFGATPKMRSQYDDNNEPVKDKNGEYVRDRAEKNGVPQWSIEVAAINAATGSLETFKITVAHEDKTAPFDSWDAGSTKLAVDNLMMGGSGAGLWFSAASVAPVAALTESAKPVKAVPAASDAPAA